MDFPIADLMDEDACYAKLVAWLHPDGLACPRCVGRDRLGVHRRHRAPVLDYRCGPAGGSSTPSPARPCRAPSGGPSSWS